jgi:sulfonate transport system permease protein
MTAVDRTPSVASSGEGITIIERPTTRPGPRSGSRAATVALGLVVPAALLVAWWVAAATESVPASILPPPAEVLDAAVRLAANGSLWEHLSTSLVRVATGFAIGAGLAVVIGIAVGLSPLVDRLLTPTLLAIRAVPSLAWVPLLVLWVGLGEQPKVILIAIGAFFPVLATLVSGLRQVDPGLMEVARTYGLSPLQRVRTVLLPTAAPSLLAGARLGLAQAWLFLVAAELLGAAAGLGFLLVDSQNTGRVEVILLTIVLLAVVGKLTDAALAVLESRVIRRLR